MAVKAQPVDAKRTATRQQEFKIWSSLVLHGTVPGDKAQKASSTRGNKTNDGKNGKRKKGTGSSPSAEAGQAMQAAVVVAVTDKKARISGPKPEEQQPNKQPKKDVVKVKPEKTATASKTESTSVLDMPAHPRSSLKTRRLSFTESTSTKCPTSPGPSMPDLRRSRSMDQPSSTMSSPPLVRFGPATVQLVEVGPGRRLNPLGRKNRTRSGLPFLAPRDSMPLLLLPLLLPSSPKKLKRHLHNQAAMGRYYLRTEEEEARLRAGEKKVSSQVVDVGDTEGHGRDAGSKPGGPDQTAAGVEVATDAVASAHKTTTTRNPDENCGRKREEASPFQAQQQEKHASRGAENKVTRQKEAAKKNASLAGNKASERKVVSVPKQEQKKPYLTAAGEKTGGNHEEKPAADVTKPPAKTAQRSSRFKKVTPQGKSQVVEVKIGTDQDLIYID